MAKKKALPILLLIVPLMVGCAPQLTQPELSSIKTVSIVNTFSEQPNFTIVRTTIFNNHLGSLGDSKYFDKLNAAVKNSLVEKGYEIGEIIKDRKEMTHSSDMVLTLYPRDIYQWPETDGYGVYQRTFLGMKNKPVVYVALNINPEVHGKTKGSAYFHSVVTELTFDVLPEGWDQLSAKEKAEVDLKLNDAIDQAVSELLQEIGI